MYGKFQQHLQAELAAIREAGLYKNERLITKRGTLISTNLDPKQLKAQYTERSTSRILGEYDILPFYGSDIRAKKRKQ